ncbi:MurR/RpiR family transcriptional regulator [Cryobacterium sp. Y11]|uniref:MurR/RpiR family transcriptional regulator n=1 Tax=Cryobacterium sp. Y11 TaxID=2045016 RepID=UPI00130484B3|nr:MurR/RpiR family transcriptional regulator [Cryobacterium sp. Y11]
MIKNFADARPDDLLAHSRELLPGLTATERRLLEWILADPDRVPLLSITEVSRAVECSEATVVRLCQRLGLRGYGQLRLLLSRRSVDPVDLARGPIELDESDHEILVKTLGHAARLLETIAGRITAEMDANFSRAVDAVGATHRLLVLGIGASSAIAQDAAQQLRTIGLRVDSPIDPFTQLFEAGRLERGDVCLIISHTGTTTDILRCADAAGAAGATRVAVSSYRTTPLQGKVELLLVTGGLTPTFRPEAAMNRVAHLLVLDALVTAVALRHRDRSAAALEYLHSVTATNQI